MVKYIIIFLVFIFGTLIFIYVTVSSPSVYRETVSFPANPHVYNDPNRSIKDIKIVVFYFVPKDRVTSQLVGWKEILDSRLKKLVAFHSLELHGISNIRYAIYSQPVIGLEESAIYDTDVTNHGNPQALVHVAQEINARVFDPAGDLYSQDFSVKQKEEYSVLLILYEGVGASGGIIYDSELGSVSKILQELSLPKSITYPVKIKTIDGFLLLNRKYVTKTQDLDTGTTILVHEFYHALGVPDGYETVEENGIPSVVSTSNDIMGIGRTRLIDTTYMSGEVLKGLGL